ncbi:hypothetical protein ID964_004446 [Salmonella enterica]|nr:hypothetical protein [Salmonella enterica]
MLYFRLITPRDVEESDVDRRITVPIPSNFIVGNIDYPEKVDLDFGDDVPQYRVEIPYPDKREVFYVCTRDHAFIMNGDFKTVETIHRPTRFSEEIREKFLRKKRK